MQKTFHIKFSRIMFLTVLTRVNINFYNSFKKCVHFLKTFHLTHIERNHQNELRVIQSCLNKKQEVV